MVYKNNSHAARQLTISIIVVSLILVREVFWSHKYWSFPHKGKGEKELVMFTLPYIQIPWTLKHFGGPILYLFFSTFTGSLQSLQKFLHRKISSITEKEKKKTNKQDLLLKKVLPKPRNIFADLDIFGREEKKVIICLCDRYFFSSLLL